MPLRMPLLMPLLESVDLLAPLESVDLLAPLGLGYSVEGAPLLVPRLA